MVIGFNPVVTEGSLGFYVSPDSGVTGLNPITTEQKNEVAICLPVVD